MQGLIVGQWDDWEDWMLRSHLIDIENEAAQVRMEIKRRDTITASYFTRDERKAQIGRLLSNGQIFTTSQVAKALHMAASQNLRNMLCELYDAGKILGYAEGKVANHPIYYWYIQASLPLPFPQGSRDEPCVGAENLISHAEQIYEEQGL